MCMMRAAGSVHRQTMLQRQFRRQERSCTKTNSVSDTPAPGLPTTVVDYFPGTSVEIGKSSAAAEVQKDVLEHMYEHSESDWASESDWRGSIKRQTIREVHPPAISARVRSTRTGDLATAPKPMRFKAASSSAPLQKRST